MAVSSSDSQYGYCALSAFAYYKTDYVVMPGDVAELHDHTRRSTGSAAGYCRGERATWTGGGKKRSNSPECWKQKVSDI